MGLSLSGSGPWFGWVCQIYLALMKGVFMCWFLVVVVLLVGLCGCSCCKKRLVPNLVGCPEAGIELRERLRVQY